MAVLSPVVERAGSNSFAFMSDTLVVILDEASVTVDLVAAHGCLALSTPTIASHASIG
jgi:hypothetical protein